ncbi:glucose 1-dehydrogenase [SAR202 cluster bacterium AD-802-E10_MRT_200m]|nr:glucose 1-dehydrogenase [SAR202 cluster bacterium AD-802-E10_MRT_200m]
MNKSMFDLTGKVALVTGGNGGIGLGISKGLANSGADVVICGRDWKKTEQAVAEVSEIGRRVLGLVTEVTDEDSVSAMVKQTIKEFQRIDILVNNAGVSIRKAPQDYSITEWEYILGVNLTGTFLCSREVYPVMKKNHGGKIVNIGSMTSIFGNDYVMPYSASKGGVVQLTKSLAIAWAKENIQVNAILPGWINTDLTLPLRTNPEFRERYELISSRIPQGRWGECEEIGGAAVFLASHASDYVTGIALSIDGGYSSF